MILGPNGQPTTPGAPPQLVDPSGAPVSSGPAALPQASRPVTAEDLQELLGRIGATATHVGTKRHNAQLFNEVAVWLVDMWNHIAAVQAQLAAAQDEIRFHERSANERNAARVTT